MHLKGQYVNLLIKTGSSYSVIAASTSCDFNIQGNTSDAAAKDDPGHGMFDNPDFQNYSWTMSNESFLVDIGFLGTLLDKVINGDATFEVQYQHSNGYGNQFAYNGKAIVSSLTVDAVNGDFVKVNISADGTGELTTASEIMVVPMSSALPRIKGKALMIAVNTSGDKWKTIACAKSHKLTISLNLSDITDKDYNDKTVLKEVTGKSVSLSTENLIEIISEASNVRGYSMRELATDVMNGTTLKLKFGYYPNSIGNTIHGGSPSAHDDGWGDAETTLLTGDFLCTSFQNNGTNKEDSQFSAEFQNKGAVTVTHAVAALSEE